jgi:hypothetical protein
MTAAETSLPEPPSQRQPWQPPETKLAAELVSATAALFEAGLADPRGCEYRAIEIETGDCWDGGGDKVKTHGWVLPSAKEAQPRFAVGWNGLVYPLASVGERADVKADVLALVKADKEMRAQYAKNSSHDYYRVRHAWPEKQSLSHQSLLPLKACLLLRLGEAELAREVWLAWTAGMQENTNDDAVHLRDPYLMLATDWVWALFDRAVCAHMRGDDALALASARALVPIQKAIEAQAEARGFGRPEPRVNAQKEGKQRSFPFLDGLPALLEDQERRAKQGPRELVLEAGLEKYPDKAVRIAALIEDLEEVDARQSGQPGGVSLGADPVVTALIHEGEEAVEPLLSCLENDTRLTRSVHFWRAFSPHRSLLGVHEAAYVALTGILNTSFFSIAATGDDLSGRGEKGRKQTAAAIRAYWQQFKDVPPEERWYQLLKNDQAAEQWLQAAGNIVQPVDDFSTPSSQFGGWVTVPRRKPGEVPKLRGEALRKKTEPSVSTLLVKRMRDLASRPDDSVDRVLRVTSGLASALAQWDGKANLDELRWFGSVMEKRFANKGRGDYPYLIEPLMELYFKRFELGDARARQDYAAWVTTVRPEQVEQFSRYLFDPLWKFPDDPDLKAAAERLFQDEKSPWVFQVKRAAGSSEAFRSLLPTPLVSVAAFRHLVLEGLADRSRAGTITRTEDGGMRVQSDYSRLSGPQPPKNDPLLLKPGAETTFRRCDVYAQDMSWLSGAPHCELYWPEANRDQAVAACAAFLTQYGDRFGPSPFTNSPLITSWREMTFPALDHPATAEDVKRGLAIFSLANEGQVRQWPMPSHPLAARWLTFKEHPYEIQRRDPKSDRMETVTLYDQGGLVWQAEEVCKDGNWERYYGFVRQHFLIKVPAREVEFTAGYLWAELSRQLDCLVSPPRVSEKEQADAERLEVGKPLQVRIQLRNRAGLNQTVPAVYYRAASDQGPALHAGIELHLSRDAEPTKGSRRNRGRQPEEKQWIELTPKRNAHFQSNVGEQILSPTEEVIFPLLDLNDWFDIREPGSYRVQVSFTTKDGGFADGQSSEVQFVIRAPTEKKP